MRKADFSSQAGRQLDQPGAEADGVAFRKEEGPVEGVRHQHHGPGSRKEAFRRDAWKYGYHIQAGFYQMGVAISLGLDRYPPFVFLAVEKSAPYGVAVYSASENFALVGRDRAGELLQRLKACRDAGLGAENWPGYPAELNELELPAWAN